MRGIHIGTSGRARRRAATVVAALALVAGCGSGEVSTRAEDQEQLTPQAALVAAAQQAQDVTSSRFTLTTSSTVAGTSFELRGEGAFDYATGTGEMTFSLPGGAGELQQRVLGDVVYVQMPNEPDVFHELRLSELLDTSLAETANPTAGLQALRGANDDVVEVGQEELRGEQTTHYRGTLDLAEGLDALKGPMRDLLEQNVALSELDPMPFDAWLDDEGRLRRFDQRLTLPVAGQSIEVVTQLEMYDFGVEVDVTAPPAEQVRDGGPLLETLGAGRPS